MKGNALILLSNGKIQPNTSSNPDEKKIGRKKDIYLAGSGQFIVVKKRNKFTEKPPKWTTVWRKKKRPHKEQRKTDLKYFFLSLLFSSAVFYYSFKTISVSIFHFSQCTICILTPSDIASIYGLQYMPVKNQY